MDTNCRRQRKSEDSGTRLLPTRQGHSLEQNRTEPNKPILFTFTIQTEPGEMTLCSNEERHGHQLQKTEKARGLWHRATSCSGRTQAGTEQNKPILFTFTIPNLAWSLFVGCLTSQQQASDLRDGSAQTILRAATLR